MIFEPHSSSVLTTTGFSFRIFSFGFRKLNTVCFILCRNETIKSTCSFKRTHKLAVLSWLLEGLGKKIRVRHVKDLSVRRIMRKKISGSDINVNQEPKGWCPKVCPRELLHTYYSVPLNRSALSMLMGEISRKDNPHYTFTSFTLTFGI